MSDNVIDMLAPEFASFPNLMGDVRYGYGTSYYGQGGKSADAIKKAYQEASRETEKIHWTNSVIMPTWIGITICNHLIQILEHLSWQLQRK